MKTRTTVVPLLCYVLAFGCASHPSTSSFSQDDEVLVTFFMPESSPAIYSGSQRTYRNGSRWTADLLTRQRVKRFAKHHDLTIRDGWPIESLGVYCVAFKRGPDSSLETLQIAAESIAHVHRVQANQTFAGMGNIENSVYNDPLFHYQFGEHTEKLAALHSYSRGGEVKVGIIDSTVDVQHPDLVGQISGFEEIAQAESLADMKHGTAVTGVIAAANDNRQGVVGVAPDAEIHVFGACHSRSGATACNSFDLARALQSAIDSEIQLLNMSLAGPYDPLISDLIDAAYRRGVIIIAAENHLEPNHNFPANVERVFAASGMLGLWFTKPEQLTTQAGGGYQVFKGTSVSAAGLSGVAALVRSQHSLQETRAMLERLQTGCTDTRHKLFDDDACL